MLIWKRSYRGCTACIYERRTLDNAFIILDEAQNTTPAQMKMFLTRIGFGSKVVVTGDMTQKDLPRDTVSVLRLRLRFYPRLKR